MIEGQKFLDILMENGVSPFRTSGGLNKWIIPDY